MTYLVLITSFLQVVKRPGVIIKPIEFEDPLEKPERGGEKHELKNRGNGDKTMKKTKARNGGKTMKKTQVKAKG